MPDDDLFAGDHVRVIESDGRYEVVNKRGQPLHGYSCATPEQANRKAARDEERIAGRVRRREGA